MINKKNETRGTKPQILVDIDGEFKTLKQLSAEYNLPYITLSKRYHKGLRGYDLIKPISDKLSMARKLRAYEKQLMRNRSK
jgi:hypothetical protein